MVFYRRRLPHWQPAGKSFFVTWRLYGSLPKNLVASKDSHISGQDDLLSDDGFITTESKLHRAETGPLWLRDPRVSASGQVVRLDTVRARF